MSAECDVVIVGAGLAGLTCARRLHEAGRACVVLEAADTVGGCVRTEVVDGFRLDRGFQVLLTAYPEARRWLDYAALDLKRFNPGALVKLDEGLHRVSDPFRRPGELWATLRAPVGSWADKARIATLRARASRGTLAELFARPETTTLAALRAHGFSERMIERFMRPWLGGIFLERELTTSSRVLEFVFRMFARGDTAVPARGMQAIPDQLAAGLPAGTVRLNAAVESIDGGGVGGVRLTSGEYLRAKNVVVATDGATVARLLPEIGQPAWRTTSTVYFAAGQSPVGEGTLVLNGEGRGRVNSVVIMSDVAPDYAPAGQALVAVSILGEAREDDRALFTLVQAELGAWWGAEVAGWRGLRVVRIRQPMPVALPGGPLRPGLWVCADRHQTRSIESAMAGGRETADAIILRG